MAENVRESPQIRGTSREKVRTSVLNLQIYKGKIRNHFFKAFCKNYFTTLLNFIIILKLDAIHYIKKDTHQRRE